MFYCRNWAPPCARPCIVDCCPRPSCCCPVICPPCPVPPCLPPVTGIATNITASTALIESNFITRGGAQVTQAGIEYAANPALTQSLTAFGSISPQFSVPLSGLSAMTTYYYRAFVVAGGQRCVGEIRSFTTAATPIVITGDPFDVLDTTATIRGSSYANLPEPPTEVGIEYSLSPTLAGSLIQPAAQPITPFDVPLSGLRALTTYYYRAYAVSGGARYYGELKQFTTFLQIEIFNGVPAVITQTSVLLEDNVFEVFSQGTVVSELGVEYSTDPSFAVSTRVPGSPPTPRGGLFSVQLTGLAPNTMYNYRTYGIVNGQFLVPPIGLSETFSTLP